MTGELNKKVQEWLREQGYPTEFRVADVCRRHGFRVWQGFHLRSENPEVAPREVDVIATADSPSRDYLIRVEHLIECKWSKDKPWIVFTSQNAQMASTACVATIGNSLGWTLISDMAHDPELHQLDFFLAPDRPGYGGRQAFSKGVDHFYNALASVTELSVMNARWYDLPRKSARSGSAVLIFPLVVVEGQLYEAFFDEKLDDINLVPTKRVRCHWRGATTWNLHASVDIVTLDHLDEFIDRRSKEVGLLLSRLERASTDIAKDKHKNVSRQRKRARPSRPKNDS